MSTAAELFLWTAVWQSTPPTQGLQPVRRLTSGLGSQQKRTIKSCFNETLMQHRNRTRTFYLQSIIL